MTATEAPAPDVNEETIPETQDQVWERTALKTAPITKEELRGEEPPKEDSPVLPDRALVAPEIAEYFQTNKETEQDPALSELASLRARLEELAAPAPEEPSEMQRLLQKIEDLESRDLERERAAREQAEAEAEEARMRTLRDGVVENLRAEPDKYPGLLTLSLEGSVYNTIVQEQGARSEYEVASEAEEQVWDLYEKLHAIKTRTTSDQEQPSEATKPITTLTPNLTADDEPWSLEDAMSKGKRQAQAELWARVHANQ
jgi:uncharacterized membrane protein